MSAQNTDKFLKVAQNKGWQLGSGGIPDAAADSFTLISALDLPTDTAVLLTIDRKDANKKATPAKMERIIGVISGDNVVDCIRGVAGTAQPHNPGAVVEILVDAAYINRLIVGILMDRDQLGRRILITDESTPSGAGITTLDLASGRIQRVTMPAATQTLDTANSAIGQAFIVEIINTTGQGALTWFSTIKWADGIAPTLTGVNGKKDTFGFIVTGAGTYDGYVIGQNI
jgi:hypothetical protein